MNPSNLDLREIGRILAADHAVALDAVIADMMGCRPEQWPFFRWAK